MKELEGSSALKIAPKPITKTITKILLDAKQKPQEYLEETIVPEGGE